MTLPARLAKQKRESKEPEKEAIKPSSSVKALEEYKLYNGTTLSRPCVETASFGSPSSPTSISFKEEKALDDDTFTKRPGGSATFTVKPPPPPRKRPLLLVPSNKTEIVQPQLSYPPPKDSKLNAGEVLDHPEIKIELIENVSSNIAKILARLRYQDMRMGNMTGQAKTNQKPRAKGISPVPTSSLGFEATNGGISQIIEPTISAREPAQSLPPRTSRYAGPVHDRLVPGNELPSPDPDHENVQVGGLLIRDAGILSDVPKSQSFESPKPSSKPHTRHKRRGAVDLGRYGYTAPFMPLPACPELGHVVKEGLRHPTPEEAAAVIANRAGHVYTPKPNASNPTIEEAKQRLRTFPPDQSGREEKQEGKEVKFKIEDEIAKKEKYLANLFWWHKMAEQQREEERRRTLATSNRQLSPQYPANAQDSLLTGVPEVIIRPRQKMEKQPEPTTGPCKRCEDLRNMLRAVAQLPNMSNEEPEDTEYYIPGALPAAANSSTASSTESKTSDKNRATRYTPAPRTPALDTSKAEDSTIYAVPITKGESQLPKPPRRSLYHMDRASSSSTPQDKTSSNTTEYTKENANTSYENVPSIHITPPESLITSVDTASMAVEPSDDVWEKIDDESEEWEVVDKKGKGC